MKAAALGRGKAKDAYDIYFCLKHFTGGVEALANEFTTFKGHTLVIEMIEKFQDKFASPEHSGPADVVSFLEVSDSEQIEITKRDVYEQVSRLIELITAD